MSIKEFDRTTLYQQLGLNHENLNPTIAKKLDNLEELSRKENRQRMEKQPKFVSDLMNEIVEILAPGKSWRAKSAFKNPIVNYFNAIKE